MEPEPASEEEPLDEPTAEADASPVPEATSPGIGGIAGFVGGDDDSIDLAKTQKFERRSYTDIESDPDGPGDPAPPEDDEEEAPKRRRRRSRKGKRRTVKIPDDNVPSTPTPPSVSNAQELLEAVAAEMDDETFDAAATIQRPIVAAAGGPTEEPAIPAEDATPTPAIPGALPAPKPPPQRGAGEADGGAAADDIYDAPTMLRGPPDDELRARLAALPDPTAGDPAAPDASPVPDAATAAPDAAAEEVAADAPDAGDVVEPDDLEDPDPSRRESAPGIFTDDSSIAVLRPVQVVNSLPPMEEQAGEDAPARRPLPPPRAHLASDAALDQIEEIIPDRMSLPGPTPETVAADFAAPDAAVDPTGDTAQQRPMTAAEADLAIAEARAREAEAKAKALEAKARAAAAKADAARGKTARPPKKPWYQVIFEDELVRTLDNPKKKDVERESSFIEECLRLDRGSRILDLACGTGVHAVELASRGYQVVGVDLSTTMLKLAEGYNNARSTSVSFIQGDMRKLNLEGVFDGIYCWASSFGYFDDQQNAQVLERVSRALRPGGMFALDVSNRDYIAPNSPSMAWFEKPGVVCMDEARFDFFTSRLHTKRMVLFDSGKSREIEMSMRLYTLTELGRLLQKVGFEVLEVSGHRAYRGAYFGSCSPRIIVTSRKKDGDPET